MPYVTLAQIRAALPAEITAQLLDEHGSGAPDAGTWAEVLAAVETEIDGKLAARFTLPLPGPTPVILRYAALTLAAELLYQRRGYHGESNPWTKRAELVRGTQGQQGGQPGLLDRIVGGEVPLTASTAPAKPQATAITSPAKTHSQGGYNFT